MHPGYSTFNVLPANVVLTENSQVSARLRQTTNQSGFQMKIKIIIEANAFNILYLRVWNCLYGVIISERIFDCQAVAIRKTLNVYSARIFVYSDDEMIRSVTLCFFKDFNSPKEKDLAFAPDGLWTRLTFRGLGKTTHSPILPASFPWLAPSHQMVKCRYALQFKWQQRPEKALEYLSLTCFIECNKAVVHF